MEPLDPAAMEAAVRRLSERDDNLDGIPVFLALEDLDDAAQPPQDDPEGRRLGELARTYLERRLGPDGTASLEDIAQVLQLLGAEHFDPGAPSP